LVQRPVLLKKVINDLEVLRGARECEESYVVGYNAAEFVERKTHVSGEHVASNFRLKNINRVVSATETHGLILGSLDRNRYFFFQAAPQTEWTPFQTHYSENLVAPGIKPGTSESVATNSDD
jgi:hypothetical protein